MRSLGIEAPRHAGPIQRPRGVTLHQAQPHHQERRTRVALCIVLQRLEPRGGVGRSPGQQQEVGEEQPSRPIGRLKRHAHSGVLDGALQLVAVELREREQRRERGDVRPEVMQLLQEALAVPVLEQAQRPRGAPFGREGLKPRLPLDHPESLPPMLSDPETSGSDGVPEPSLDRCRPAFKRHTRSEAHTSELQSPCNVVCRLLLEKEKASTGDGMFAALQNIKMMLTKQRPLSELATQVMERVPQVLENVTLAARRPLFFFY